MGAQKNKKKLKENQEKKKKISKRLKKIQKIDVGNKEENELK